MYNTRSGKGDPGSVPKPLPFLTCMIEGDRHEQCRSDFRNACVQRYRYAAAPAEGDVQSPPASDKRGQTARYRGGKRRRKRHEGLGDRARRYALHALVSAADRHHRRKARQLYHTHRRRTGHHGVLRQGAHSGSKNKV